MDARSRPFLLFCSPLLLAGCGALRTPDLPRATRELREGLKDFDPLQLNRIRADAVEIDRLRRPKEQLVVRVRSSTGPFRIVARLHSTESAAIIWDAQLPQIDDPGAEPPLPIRPNEIRSSEEDARYMQRMKEYYAGKLRWETQERKNLQIATINLTDKLTSSTLYAVSVTPTPMQGLAQDWRLHIECTWITAEQITRPYVANSVKHYLSGDYPGHALGSPLPYTIWGILPKAASVASQEGLPK